jgi:methylglyoxal synthase
MTSQRIKGVAVGGSVTIVMGSMSPIDWDPAAVDPVKFLSDVYTVLDAPIAMNMFDANTTFKNVS